MNFTTSSQKPINKNIITLNENIKKRKKTSYLSKNKKKLLIIIEISLVLITVIVLLCVFLIKKKKTYNTEKIENKIEFYIIGTYEAEKGIPIKLFNPSEIGLTDENYTVEIVKINNINTTTPQKINVTEGIYIPEKDEKIQIKITFDKELTNLDFMFEGCSSLIKIDLSNLNSPNIRSMIYTFTNCEQLETVNFTSFQSSNVTKMDFLFSGCSNLININGF